MRTPARRALPLALSRMRMPLARPRTHARPPLHPPPLHAPPRAARTHRTKVLDCVLPVAACTALFISLSLYGYAPYTTPRGKGGKVSTCWSSAGRQPVRLRAESPFPLLPLSRCCLPHTPTYWCHSLPRTDILVSLGVTVSGARFLRRRGR